MDTGPGGGEPEGAGARAGVDERPGPAPPDLALESEDLCVVVPGELDVQGRLLLVDDDRSRPGGEDVGPDVTPRKQGMGRWFGVGVGDPRRPGSRPDDPPDLRDLGDQAAGGPLPDLLREEDE